jgi:hypothetical protein
VIGTWKLNVAQSTTANGPATGGESRTCAQGADGIRVTINIVAADGKAPSSKTTCHLDGKAYPVTGNADFGSLSGKQQAVTIRRGRAGPSPGSAAAGITWPGSRSVRSAIPVLQAVRCGPIGQLK